MSTSIKEAMERAFTMKQPMTLPPEWDDEKYQPPQEEPKENQMQQTQQTHQTQQMQQMQHMHAIQKLSITETIFNFVRDSTPYTRAELTHIIAKGFGFKEPTVNALLTQLLRAGLIKYGEHNFMEATTDKYSSSAMTKSTYKYQEQSKRKQLKITRRAAPEVDATKHKGIGQLLREKLDAPVVSTFNAEAYVNQQLTVGQAREVYVYLKQLFGG